MSGHNKWSKIKHKKQKRDRRRAKLFNKLIREITVAAREGGGDPEYNPRLRVAIERAHEADMPKDNIERAIQKGVSNEAADMEHVRFETYAPGGIAVIIEGLTDNNNRTSSEVKQILAKHNCELAEMGAAGWAFEKQDGQWTAQTTMEPNEEDRAKLEELVEALEENEDVQQVYHNASTS